ncbi:TPA: restriction endonuclease [Enterococcus faecalis]
MMKKKVENYIQDILVKNYGENWENIYEQSDLIQYLNLKSGAIHGNSKTRRSLANWYAIYAILYYYEKKGFVNQREKYLNFEGFPYTPLYNFQREQYGGSKLQNHGFNNRAIGEFANKTGNDVSKPLIINNSGKYLIHPDYLYVGDIDIVPTVLEIIKQYQEILFAKDHSFVEQLAELKKEDTLLGKQTKIKALLTEDSEARVFEIISYAILETHYKNQVIYIGWTRDKIEEKILELFKTGRTNANDGGIDFVMKPLGRFFQVTEVNNYNKYFLDMEKVNHFPITFVVKTTLSSKAIFNDLLTFGTKKSGGLHALERIYHESIEEVITINELSDWLEDLSEKDLNFLISEIDRYYKLEMNISDGND